MLKALIKNRFPGDWKGRCLKVNDTKMKGCSSWGDFRMYINVYKRFDNIHSVVVVAGLDILNR